MVSLIMNQTQIQNFLVSYDNAEEFHILKNEIFTKESYFVEPKHVKAPTPVILDIGAHIGLATLYFKQKFPSAKILALEPNPANFAILQQNIGQNGLRDVTAIQAAISIKSGTKEFFVDDTGENWFSTGSFTPKAWNGMQATASITVQTLSLADLLAQSSISSIAILKLDIEGYEQTLLKNSADVLEKVENIIFEFHPTEFGSIKKIEKLLRKAGLVSREDDDEKASADGLKTYCYYRKEKIND